MKHGFGPEIHPKNAEPDPQEIIPGSKVKRPSSSSVSGRGGRGGPAGTPRALGSS